MSLSLDSLKQTTTDAHLYRVWVEVTKTNEWYRVIREANELYGRNNWRCQPKTKRKLDNNWHKKPIKVWFMVPDVKFATWVSVKLSIIAGIEANK